MPTITLTHCTAVRIYPRPLDHPPQDVKVNLTVGGSSGDGTVDVHSNGPAGPVAASFSTGVSGSVTVPGANDVWLHYMAVPGEPQTVEVTYSLDVS